MKTSSTALDVGAMTSVSPLPTTAKLALHLLEKISIGSLRLTLPDGHRMTFGSLEDIRENAHHADLQLRNWNLCSAVFKSGDIGFAEGYMDNDWQTSNLPELLMLLIANRNQLESVVYGSWWGQLTYRIKHWLNRNSKAQARKNIHAHYDLGNSFYSTWLDKTMTYSSALFGNRPDQTLEEAQDSKYKRALEQLRLKPGSRVLEIGAGWGGMAETLVKAGHSMVGLTLSTEQLAWAQERLNRLTPKEINKTPTGTQTEAGAEAIAPKAEFLLQDYRDTNDSFDGIVSIEMFEAVGEKYWQSYFECVSRNLKPGGYACIQSITIADELFERYRVGTDFIQQYIFPGGMLPSQTRFKELAHEHGFQVTSVYAFGQDYARTLSLWRDRFMSKLDEVKAQGFDDRFNRTWEFYLAYCEAAFAKNNTNVVQFTLKKI
jgi:cyclopropane-fatty-acyl-phospholipid synthase